MLFYSLYGWLCVVVLQYRGKTELINGTASGGIVGGLIGLRGMFENQRDGCVGFTHCRWDLVFRPCHAL